MNQSINKLFASLLLFLFAITARAELSMELDTAKIPFGQTFRLTLTLDNDPNRATPDLRPLQKDFTLVGTERMANFTIVNGQSHSLNQWVIILMPKQVGILTIPAIHVGQAQTKASRIEVTTDNTPSATQNNESSPVKLTTEVSEHQPYLNQQVIYTVRIYNSRRLLDAEYVPPHAKDALMVTLGEAKRRPITENGTSYVVEELQYAFFPQKSGILKIIPPQFNALVFDAIPGKVQLQGKVVSLNVKPMPTTNSTTTWLPAKQVTLNEVYDNNSSKIEQGEMIIRNVTLKAVGAAAQLLPQITFASTKRFSVYPEKPNEQTQYQNPDLVGTVTIKVTYLFNQAGTVVIPELKLPWFNTVSGQFETASLPARTIHVSALTNNRPTTPAALHSPSSSPSSQAVTNQSTTPKQLFSPKLMSEHFLAWKIAAGFAIAWIVTLFLWWWSRRPHNKSQLKKLRKKIGIACLQSDPVACKNALIDWANLVWPNTHCSNLAEVEKLVSAAPLKKAINQLSQQLYRSDKEPWQGNELWRHLANYKPAKNNPQKKEKDPLPPINP